MAIIQDPRVGASSAAIVDPTFDALRMTLRPTECQGTYRLAFRSGTLAAGPLAAAAALVSFRYYGTGSCLVHSVKVGLSTTLAFTQGAATMTLNVMRGMQASDTGGTQATLGNIQKLRSAMTQPQVDIRYPTTAGLTVTAITGGVEDPAPFASVQLNLPAAPLQTTTPMEFFPMSWYSKPLTLTMNEGFRIRNLAAFSATGTSILTFSIYWSEYPAVSTFFY